MQYDGDHSIFQADNVRALLKQFRAVMPCECDECRPELAGHKAGHAGAGKAASLTLAITIYPLRITQRSTYLAADCGWHGPSSSQ